MKCHPSLRLRLWCGALLLALLSVIAAMVAIYGLSRSQSFAHEAMTAQRRMEAYAAHTARVNDWMLGWLMVRGEVPDPTRVLATLTLLDRLAAEDMAAARPGVEADNRLRPSLTPSRLRGYFMQLAKALDQTPPGTAAGDAAIAFYAVQAPLATERQIANEERRRDQALAQMEALRQPMHLAAISIAIAVPLILLAIYLLTFRPLFARLSHASQNAEAMAQGNAPSGVAGHDELGLMFARLRQIGARLDRRRAQLLRDHAQLESIVTERTAALSTANARLAQIDASRRRFFADVGHELRTPLTVILGEAELGARHGDPAVVAAFETVKTRAERLFRRIEDLLRIARSESGQLELSREPVRLDQIITLAASDLAPILRRAGVSLTLDLPPEPVAGDADWLRQVFAGLMENAAKYAGRGAQMRISGQITRQNVTLSISDTGPGISPGSDPFQRFARAGTAAGFGVGLALARWVVEASGGSLQLAVPEAQSMQGHGLQMRMVLPRWTEG